MDGDCLRITQYAPGLHEDLNQCDPPPPPQSLTLMLTPNWLLLLTAESSAQMSLKFLLVFFQLWKFAQIKVSDPFISVDGHGTVLLFTAVNGIAPSVCTVHQKECTSISKSDYCLGDAYPWMEVALFKSKLGMALQIVFLSLFLTYPLFYVSRRACVEGNKNAEYCFDS